MVVKFTDCNGCISVVDFASVNDFLDFVRKGGHEGWEGIHHQSNWSGWVDCQVLIDLAG